MTKNWRTEASYERTWVQLLIDSGYRDVAAIAVDSQLEFKIDQDGGLYAIQVAVPTFSNAIVKKNERIRKVIEESVLALVVGRYWDTIEQARQYARVLFTIRLLDVEQGWQQIAKELIANATNPNQGIVTQKLFARDGREPYTYNEMKFASQSEIRIAQELEQRQVLFCPLPLAVRAETGNFYEDHRECDFLICQEGAWGILEVAYHLGRYEKDAEKDIWWKKSGILCIQHYPAEKCYQTPGQVVDEFLGILARYRK